jgi:hypothetical protein
VNTGHAKLCSWLCRCAGSPAEDAKYGWAGRWAQLDLVKSMWELVTALVGARRTPQARTGADAHHRSGANDVPGRPCSHVRGRRGGARTAIAARGDAHKARRMLDVAAAVAEIEPGPADGMQVGDFAGSALNGMEQARNDTERAPNGHAVVGDSDDEDEDVLLPRACAPSESSGSSRKWQSALVSISCVIVTQSICFIYTTREQGTVRNTGKWPRLGTARL